MRKYKLFAQVCIGLTLLTAVDAAGQVTFKRDGKQTKTVQDTTKKQFKKTADFVRFGSNSGQSLSGDSARVQQSGAISKPRKTYYLPDGSIVPQDRVDSVAKAWGGLNMQRDLKKDPSAIFLLPPTNQNMKLSQSTSDQQYEQLVKKFLGRAAPDFTLKDLQGRSWKLSALKGKVVVLNFWFTECKPCIEEIPSLNALRIKFKKSDVVFLGLALNQKQTVEAFVGENRFDYQIFPEARTVTTEFGIYAWPTHAIIDRSGVIKFLKVGTKNAAEELEEKISSIL